jgi:phenylalanyl-tRNA synthetase alpha chain
MSDSLRVVDALREAAARELEPVSDADQLERWRIAHLGRSAPLNELLGELGKLAADERRALGQAVNRAKAGLQSAFDARQEQVKASEREASFASERIDVTLPGRPLAPGRLHPITQTIEESLRILQSMGFQVAETPEVELDYYNFEVLNIPAEHPARDMWDTLYVQPPNVLLRTHTTAYQGRMMQLMRPPIRVVNVGRNYRFEAVDATHEWMFHQIDGFAIDQGLTLADLKGTLTAFAQQIFWPNVRTRFRCDYFPFVEPGVDMSISCHACDGRGGDCGVCRGAGWLEILGAGMVHPKVMEMGGLDPDRYSGFAWGMGPERIAMIKFGIQDIRLFYGNDLRFLEQFA